MVEGLYLGKIVRFILYKLNKKRTDYTHLPTRGKNYLCKTEIRKKTEKCEQPHKLS